LAEINTLKTPLWGLVDGERSLQLFDALHKNFRRLDGRTIAIAALATRGLVSLIEQGRVAEALELFSGVQLRGNEEERISIPMSIWKPWRKNSRGALDISA